MTEEELTAYIKLAPAEMFDHLVKDLDIEYLAANHERPAEFHERHSYLWGHAVFDDANADLSIRFTEAYQKGEFGRITALRGQLCICRGALTGLQLIPNSYPYVFDCGIKNLLYLINLNEEKEKNHAHEQD